jgi:hypothetical protein
MSKRECSERRGEIQKLLRDYAEEANEWAHFSQRKGGLSAAGFVQIVVLGWLQAGQASLNQLVQVGEELGYAISETGLHQRMDGEGVLLLASVLQLALKGLQQECPLALSLLQGFSSICVTDSTQIALPAALAEHFAGNQGNGMLKLQVVWDYLNGNLLALETQAGKTPDQKCQLHVAHAQPDSLQLFDLGYFKQEYLQQIAQREAFFVCRWQSQTALYQPESARRIDLVGELKAFQGSQMERVVWLGGRVRLPVRLLLRRLNPQTADARRRKAQDKARKQGKPCSEAYLFLLGWDILLSNLPTADWSLAQLFDLYAIRTQIEWVFRIWKDQLALDALGHWRVERVLCQLYAHLIGALLCHCLTARWRWHTHEYSFCKCVQIIQMHIPLLLRCLARAGWGLNAWIGRLEAAFRQFGRKSKRRKSPSTSQRLYNWGLT